MPSPAISRRTAVSVVAAFAAVAVSALVAPLTRAAPITTLFNTGVDSSGAVLPDNAAELHYAAVPVPAPFDAVGTPPGNTSGASTFTGPGVVARGPGGFPIPPWVGDNAASAWVTPAADTVGPGGNYAWNTTFDLSGFVPSSAVINGRWSSDNSGLDILVNGVSTGQTNPTQFAGFSGFVIPPSLLLPATNRLTFIVNNGAGEDTEAGPTGVRVEFDQRQATLIPEPAALGLLSMVGGIALRRRRASRQRG